jgi:site-specific DNA recombinase
LLSFAQFEREVTGERIRDKIAASKRRGLWVGGMVPLGYVSRDKKLVIEEKEAEAVRTIFRRYLELGSIGLLLTDLRERGIVTKVRHLGDGRTLGGIPFTGCTTLCSAHPRRSYPASHLLNLTRLQEKYCVASCMTPRRVT